MSQAQQRRLAAVMFVDMVGFTELMGRDEVAAREARDRQRNLVAGQVSRFGGEVRQFYGDGTLTVAYRGAGTVERPRRPRPPGCASGR